MTDTNVTELHPSPRKGEGPSPGALRQRRYRARRKRVTRNAGRNATGTRETCHTRCDTCHTGRHRPGRLRSSGRARRRRRLVLCTRHDRAVPRRAIERHCDGGRHGRVQARYGPGLPIAGG
jgi:hypothetical protein